MSAASTPATASTPAADAERGGARAVAGGLVALTLVTIALQVMIGEVIPPVVVLGVLFLITAATMLGASRAVARWAAVVLPVVLVVANLPFAVADLQHPESPAGFVPTLAIVAIALATAGLALRHARGRSVPGRAVWGVVAGVLVVGTGASLAVGAALVDDTAGPDDTTVEVVDLAYPEQLVVASGDSVLLDNRDPFRHTFVVDGTDVTVELPGTTARRVGLDLPAGEYRYLCDVPGHESMEGVLVVE